MGQGWGKPSCAALWSTEVRAWGGLDARLGSAAASSQVSAPLSGLPGSGHEPAHGEGKKTSQPSLVKGKARGGVSWSLDVYLGDFFFPSECFQMPFSVVLEPFSSVLK